jgi:magnesium-transporting ATPase (P-type)
MRIFQRMGVFPYLLLGIGLFVIGLMAFEYVVNNFWPVDTTRLDLIRATALDRADAAILLEAANPELIIAFLATILVMATGLALPLAYFLNKRFGRYADERFGESSATPFLVILRQAMGVGFWAAFCVWLQMNRAFGLAAALLVAGVLILFEMLLQIRTRAASVSSSP